ncbi:uncharacterized protein LOC119292028 [Triticum dicoccoides]|uniref:uncharacterized protein LOC119292028 n=1 Tax=Triticum dicoccoides TaxID=85692 RepID=UPI000E7D11C0|nr:uncharacterized protein LOC119292028 [Triticum dicoccoides]XP_037426752.1 uncharacterized protein LOC119292028 [Triticum dicoccoides]XP_037426753.1 uncharacterized protein LOC119292028 [Triticum dicoccoides]
MHFCSFLSADAILNVMVKSPRMVAILSNVAHGCYNYALIACTDPTAAMAELRPGNMGWPSEVVMVDVYSLRCSAPARELLERAIGEMHVDAYGLWEIGAQLLGHSIGVPIMDYSSSSLYC